MPVSVQGILGQFEAAGQIQNDVSVVATQWFANRCVLATRLPRRPLGSVEFNVLTRKYRPRTTVLAAAIANGSVTTITVSDASTFMVGDVLAIGTERLEVTADPNTASNILTVRRGAEGTVAAAAANSAAVRLIGNSRTGAEVDQSAVSFIPTAVPQWAQTFQHPVQVGGSVQSSTGFQLPPGVQSPMALHKMEALQNMMDDIETSTYYGLGEAPTSSNRRPKQKGLRTLIQTNKTMAPTNASAYKPTDFIRDTLQACRSQGGAPDLLVMSTNWMTGLATWGIPVVRLDVGTNVFGFKVNAFSSPFLGDSVIVEAPLLDAGTAIALTSSEARMRVKRAEFYSPRGTRGDAVEADWIAEMAVDLENEQHHAWVEGITAWSAN